jgi:hypothetical protein
MSIDSATVPQEDATSVYRRLVAGGFSVSDALAVHAENNTSLDLAYIEAARDTYASGGSIEIDEPTVRSGSTDGGDYVLAWVWVSNSDVEFPDDAEPDADIPSE